MRFVVLLLSICTLSSCYYTNSNDLQSRYHNDGRVKPSVAFTPVMDHANHNLPWDISEEFTIEISRSVKNSNQLYVTQEPLLIPVTNVNAFVDHSFLPKGSAKLEFVVIAELIEHTMEPRKKTDGSIPENPSYDLHTSLRLQVIDIRYEEPKVVLQELITHTTFIPKQLAKLTYEKTGYKKLPYKMTPVGFAHSKLIKAAAARIEEYVLLAKSY